MYRRNTVEAIVRQHVREREGLLTVIREQNDRLMLLAGKPFTPSPLDLHTWPDDVQFDDEEEHLADPTQLPDELAVEAY